MLKIFNFLFFSFLFLFTVTCSYQIVDSGGGSEVEVIGTIMMSPDVPAKNTFVQCIPSNSDPVKDQSSLYSFIDTTDIHGSYSITVPKNNIYNLQAVHLTNRTRLLYKGISSVDTNINEVSVPPIMLKQPGTIIIPLPDTADANNGYVYIKGTTIYRFVDVAAVDNGSLYLDSVPAGQSPAIIYSSAIDTQVSITLLDSITVNSGDTVSLYLYIREGATGANDGSDWINAFTDLPETLIRGNTYYIADGNYCPNGYVFNTPADNDKYITILKATNSSHGTDVGWNNQYGDGQAIFTETISFKSSYLRFDGAVGGFSPENNVFIPDSNSYGFKIKPNNQTGVPHFLINAPHSADIDYIQISHCLLAQSGMDFDNGKYQQTCIYVGGDYATDHFIISHNYMAFGSVCLILYNSSNTIVENNFLSSNWVSSDVSGRLISSGWNSDLVTIRNNIFYHPKTIALGVVLEGNEYWQVYNNIVIGDGSELTSGFANANTGEIDNILSCDFHHNTFYNLDFSSGAIFIGNVTNDDTTGVRSHAYNNIFYTINNPGLEYGPNYTPGILDHSHNMYYDCTGNMYPGPTDVVIDNIDPFVNSTQFDFRLKEPSAAGKILPTPYDRDFTGKIRGEDGNWDRGAFEY